MKPERKAALVLAVLLYLCPKACTKVREGEGMHRWLQMREQYAITALLNME